MFELYKLEGESDPKIILIRFTIDEFSDGKILFGVVFMVCNMKTRRRCIRKISNNCSI